MTVNFDSFRKFLEIFLSMQSKDRRIAMAENITEEQVKLRDSRGWAVAHTLAADDCLPEKFHTVKILSLKDCNHWTVAHELAENGTMPPDIIADEQIMTLQDTFATTVLEVFADRIKRIQQQSNFFTPETLQKVLSMAKKLETKTKNTDLYFGKIPETVKILEKIAAVCADRDADLAQEAVQEGDATGSAELLYGLDTGR